MLLPVYLGPGDIIPGARVYYGLRAYNTIKANARVPAIRITDSAGSFPTDIHVTPSGGLDPADFATFAAAGGSGTILVNRMYEQTGNPVGANSDLIAFSTGESFVLSLTGSNNGKPIVSGQASTAAALSTNLGVNPGVTTQPQTINTYSRRTGAFSIAHNIFNDSVVALGLNYGAAASTVTLNGTSGGSLGANGNAADSIFISLTGLCNGASSQLYINTTLNASGTVNSTAFGPGGLFCMPTGTLADMTECMFWNGDVTANITPLVVNQATYW